MLALVTVLVTVEIAATPVLVATRAISPLGVTATALGSKNSLPGIGILVEG